MAKQSATKNYIYNLAYQILLLIAPLITAPYISRVLGANGVGAYSYTYSIVTYFILFGSIGSALYGQREIAYAQNDKVKRSQIFGEVLTLRSMTMILSIMVYLVVFTTKNEYASLYKVLLIQLGAAVFDISWFYQGMEDFKIIVVRNTLIKIVSIGLTFILVKTAADVELYAICLSIPILLGNLSMWISLPRYLTKAPVRLKRVFAHLLPMLALFAPQVATEIYTVLDKTMIGAFSTNISEVGYYEQAQKIVKIALSIVTSYGIVMLPKMSLAFAEGKKESIISNIKKSFQFVFFLGCPIMFGLIGVAGNFVPWFYGAGYEKVPQLMITMAPIVIAIGLSNVVGVQFFLPVKMQKEYTISVIGGAFLNCILNFILIPFFDSNGAAIATVFAEFSVSFIQLYLARKILPLRECILPGIKYFLLGGIMLICVLGVGRILPSNIIGTMIQICVGGFVYLILLVISRDAFLMNMLKKVLKR